MTSTTRIDGEDDLVREFLAPLAAGYRRRAWSQGRLRRAHPDTRQRAGAEDGPGRRGRAFFRRRRSSGHRVEGAGGERLGSRRERCLATYLPDGAVAPRGARTRVDGEVCGRSRRGAACVRHSPRGRRHRPHARPFLDHHHRDRRGTGWADGAPRGGPCRSGDLCLRDARRVGARPRAQDGCGAGGAARVDLGRGRASDRGDTSGPNRGSVWRQPCCPTQRRPWTSRTGC